MGSIYGPVSGPWRVLPRAVERLQRHRREAAGGRRGAAGVAGVLVAALLNILAGLPRGHFWAVRGHAGRGPVWGGRR
eukprot:11638611-Alexandrium_andersonii.AAC.1